MEQNTGKNDLQDRQWLWMDRPDQYADTLNDFAPTPIHESSVFQMFIFYVYMLLFTFSIF